MGQSTWGLLLLFAWIYNLISKSLQKPKPDPFYCCGDSTMTSDSPRTVSLHSAASGSPTSSMWRTPDRNNNSDSSMEELENALGAINLLVSPTTLSPFDFRNTRTPEEMAL